jgi:hypothetical protein
MKKIFHPKDLSQFRRNMAIIFTPFFLLFLYQADDWESRMIFLVFAAIFLAIVNALLNRTVKGGRPIILDEDGLHHENLLERYGAQDIPWPEITAIELVHGSERAEWLGLTLRLGVFRDRLKRPITDRLSIAEGDVFLSLLHDQPGREIVEEARKFWLRYRHPTA